MTDDKSVDDKWVDDKTVNEKPATSGALAGALGDRWIGRSEETGMHNYSTMVDAVQGCHRNKSIWRISGGDFAKRQHVRFVVKTVQDRWFLPSEAKLQAINQAYRVAVEKKDENSLFFVHQNIVQSRRFDSVQPFFFKFIMHTKQQSDIDWEDCKIELPCVTAQLILCPFLVDELKAHRDFFSRKVYENIVHVVDECLEQDLPSAHFGSMFNNHRTVVLLGQSIEEIARLDKIQSIYSEPELLHSFQ
jgi:hypothetical protein